MEITMHPAFTARGSRRSWVGLAPLAVLVAGALPAAIAPAAPPGPPPQFAIVGKKDVVIDFAIGGAVLVSNSRDAEGTPALKTSIAPGCALELKAPPGPIAGNGVAWVPVTVSGTKPCAPGTYAGRISVDGSDSASDIAIQVPKFSAPKTWKTTIYRWLPASRFYVCDRFPIPVQIPKLVRPPVDATLVLPREAGGSIFGDGAVLVKLTAVQGIDETPGTTRLWFQVNGGGQAGKYSGDISIPGGESPIKLEIAVKDIVLWPLLVILGSVLLTLAVQRYVSTKRPALEWKRRADAAQAAFNTATAPAAGPFFGYDVGADFLKQSNRIGRDAASFAALGNPTAAAQNQIEAAVVQLEKVPETWAAFVKALQEIDGVLSALPAALGTSPLDAARIGQTAPFFIADAFGLLAGAPMTLEAWRAILVKVSSASALLGTVLPLAQQVSVYAAAPGLPPAVRTLIDQAQSKLWRVRTGDDLQRLSIPADLDTIASQLLAAGQPAARLAAAPLGVAAALSIEPLELPEVEARRIARRLANTDLKLTALAIAIAVLFGLRDYYFDMPFGSLKDYAGLVLYGTGTKLALDLVHTSLQTLTGQRGIA